MCVVRLYLCSVDCGPVVACRPGGHGTCRRLGPSATARWALAWRLECAAGAGARPARRERAAPPDAGLMLTSGEIHAASGEIDDGCGV